MKLRIENFRHLLSICVSTCLISFVTTATLAQEAACPILTNDGISNTHTMRVSHGTSQIKNLGKTEWQSLDKVQHLDNEMATVEIYPWNRSYELRFSNFDFKLPEGATILGIQCRVVGKAEGEGNARDYYVRLMDGFGNFKGKDRANAAIGEEWTETDQDTSFQWKYGHNQDLWDTNWSVQDINSNNFGIAMQLINMNSDSVTAMIDQVIMDVSYQLPFQHCTDECIPYYVQLVDDAIDYRWIYPQGWGNHPDIGNAKNIVNLYPSSADYGTYELCVQTIFSSGPSDICCTKIEYSNCEKASLGNMVYHDENVNGIQDPGELGIPGVNLTLFSGGRVWQGRDFSKADGQYSFDDLAIGDYFVAATNFDDWIPSPANGGFANFYLPFSSDVVNLTNGENYEELDFGFIKYASFSGTAWIDQNGNGIRETDEALLEGTAFLIDESLNYLDSTILTIEGKYTFDQLIPGTYGVVFNAPNDTDYDVALINQGNDTSIDSDIINDNGIYRTSFYNLKSNEHLVNIDAGFILLRADVFGTIWIDGNGNSTQDGEDEFPGLAVKLFDCDDNLISETISDSNGQYRFEDVLAGYEYYIEIEILEDFVASPISLDNLLMADGKSACFTLQARVDQEVNAGITPYNKIGDMVWMDENRNGIQDQGEPGMDNVNLQLWDELGNLVAEQFTDDTGQYVFEALLPMNYTVRVGMIMSDLKLTEYNNTSDALLNSDFQKLNGMMTTTEIDLQGGIYRDDIDAGFVTKEGFVDGSIWNDANGDGNIANSESWMGEEKVYLHDCTGIQLAETKTNATGYFYFDNILPNQDYYLRFDEIDRYAFSFAPGDTDVTHDNGNGTTNCFMVTPGDSSAIHAGYAPLGSIGDFVWLDDNQDGIQDAAERGMQGMSVELRDVFDTVLESATTDENGKYIFENLYPSRYKVVITDVGTEYELTEYKVISGSEEISNFYDNNTELRTTFFNLYGGKAKMNIDAGFKYVDGNIQGNVWNDGNGNAIKNNSEPAMSVVNVELYSCDGNLIEQTSSDPDGNFAFTEVKSEEEYYLYFSLPENFFYSIAPGDTDISNQNGLGTTNCFILEAGTSVDLLAGYAPAATIGDYVWFDADRNGLQDTNEQGIANVTVILRDVFGEEVLRSSTDAFGYYEINMIYPAQYSVVLEDYDPNYAITQNHAVPNNPLNSVFTNNNGLIRTGLFNLYRGIEKMNIDAGFMEPVGSFSGIVYQDNNGDGIRDADEVGMEDVTILVYNCDGALVGSTSSDQNGAYRFENLLVGSEYFVAVDTPNNFGNSNPGLDNALTDLNGSGTTNCFEVTSSDVKDIFLALAPLSTIGDFMWFDGNGNGLQDIGELGIADINLNLIDPQGMLVSETISDEEGKYTFENLYPGSYSIVLGNVDSQLIPTITTGESKFITSNGNIQSTTIILSSGEVDLTIDGGFIIETGSVTGLIYRDRNGNAEQEASDEGMMDVLITLYDCNDNLIAESTTDLDGRFIFPDVAPNQDYYISYTTPDNYVYPRVQGTTDLTHNNGDGTTDCFTVTTSSIVEISGALAPLGRIGDLVWFDEDGNGLQDANENGIPNVQMILMNSSSVIEKTVMTDEDGGYDLSDLYPGDYYLTADFLGRDAILSPYQSGMDNSLDSDFELDNDIIKTEVFRLVNGFAVNNIDLGISAFANEELGAIVGRVLEDVNANNQIESEDLPLEFVSVELLDENGAVVNATETNSLGVYSFEDLENGSYLVRFNINSDYMLSTADATTNDLDFDVTESIYPFTTDLISISNGAIVTNLDAGVYLSGALGDFVWDDANQNGIQDSDELGLANKDVNLFDEARTTLIATTSTDENGNYLFDNLRPGAYSLNLNLQNEEIVTSPNATNDSNDSDFLAVNATMLFTDQIDLKSGERLLDYDAGLFTIRDTTITLDTASISGIVWEDLNADGLINNETGKSGIRVVLINKNGIMVDQANTGTDPDQDSGYFIFDNLPAGDYYLEYQIPTDSRITPAQIGSDAALNSAMTESNGTYTSDIITIGSNDNRIANAGYYFFASLGNYAWDDVNQNGIQDPSETGVNDVLIRLYDGNNSPLRLITTINHPQNGQPGFYSFINLVPGEYYISADIQSGMVFSEAFQGTNEFEDSDIDNTNGFNTTRTITLSSGEFNAGIDIGLQQQTASVGNRIWEDINGNGIQDDFEDGVNDVQVDLYTENGVLVSTTTTFSEPIEGDGFYLFEDIQPGNYFIRFNVEPGFFTTVSDKGGNDGEDSDITNVLMPGATNIFNLDPGEFNMDVDGGIYLPGSIGDFVFDDLNANGIQDAGESGLEGVEINLHRTDELYIQTVISDENGMYGFNDLRPGPYYISVALPEGKIFSPQFEGGDSNKDSDVDITGYSGMILLFYQEMITNFDIGVSSADIVLGDKVWFDENDNGLQDFNEKGIEGIKVELLDESSNVVKTEYTNYLGNYSFANPENGNYTIRFEAPEGYEFSSPKVGFDINFDSNPDINGETDQLVLTPGIYLLDIDAGLILTERNQEIANDDLILIGSNKKVYNKLVWEDSQPATGFKYELIRNNRNSTDTKIYEAFANEKVSEIEYLDNELDASGMYQYTVNKINEYDHVISSRQVEIFVSEFDLKKTMVYPNPVYDHIFIKILDQNILDQEFGIQVFDMSGKQVIQTTSKAGVKNDLSNLAHGAYTIKITIDGRSEEHLIILNN